MSTLPCRCLFCHAVDALPEQQGATTWAMRCRTCSAQGPVSPSATAAREAWVAAIHGEELLRTVIEESPDVILVKDWSGRFLLGNQALARLYGTTPAGLIGHDDGTFNPNAEQVDFYLENIRDVMRSGRTAVVTETSTDVETGEVRHFQSIKRPIVGPGGEPRILVIAHDITDLQRAHREIEDRERSYAYAMSAAGEGIWDWDIVSNVVTHNAKWGELFGFAPQELQHPIEVFTELLHADDRADVDASLRAALEGSGHYRHEHRMVRRDGSVVHVCDRGQVVERDASGDPIRMAGAVTDITDRVIAEQRMRTLAEALAEANVTLERKVEERTADLERANDELRHLAWLDALTGLPNRLAGLNHLDTEFARLQRRAAESAVLMLDVDHFKEINDTFGHGVGDDVLRQISSAIKRSLRAGDFVARFGGEEFMASLPDTGLDGARVVAEKIRGAIEDASASPAGPVTLSIGVTVAQSDDVTMDVAVRRADAALYEAKRAGRNCVVVR